MKGYGDFMIIKVKTQMEPINTFDKKIVGDNSSRDSYELSPLEILKFLEAAYRRGINNLEISVDETDFQIIKDKNRNFSKKTSVTQYFERVLEEPLKIFEKDHDIDNFFKNINFEDEQNVAKEIYQYVTDVTKDDVYTRYRGRNVYAYVFFLAFGNKAREKKAILRKQVTKWTKDYHSEFISRFTTNAKSVPYAVPDVVLVNILLKHSGYKYY